MQENPYGSLVLPCKEQNLYKLMEVSVTSIINVQGTNFNEGHFTVQKGRNLNFS
jgi:hypothetical protein